MDLCQNHNLIVTYLSTHLFGLHYITSSFVLTMSSNPASQCQIVTWAKNKTVHPGAFVKATIRYCWPTTEVEAERKAKDILEATRQQHITCTAQFEHDDMARVDALDSTPHPIVTPKPLRSCMVTEL